MEGNGNTAITRSYLQEFKRDLVSQIGEMMDTQFHQIDEQFTERLHDTETRLLKAFYQYQEHSDVRMRKMSADISNMDTASDLRLNNLERRVIELERKLLESGR